MRIQGLRYDGPMKLPEVGDLVYVELPGGRRIPLITTVSETIDSGGGGNWRFKALVDPEDQAAGCEVNR